MTAIVFVLLAYLIGSLSFAVLVSKAFGLPDPRSYGSNNPGATNVLRSGKKAAALLTLLGDGAKGWVAVWLAASLGPRYGLAPAWLLETGLPLVGVAVVVGHMWPVWFRFAGGKGVATALGVLLAFDPWLGLAVFATWLLVAVGFRLSSLAALCAAVLAPVYAWWMGVSMGQWAAVLVVAILLIARHHSNIRKLLSGQEGQIGDKKQASESATK